MKKLIICKKNQQERELEIDRLTKELDSIQNKVILADIFAQTKVTYPLIDEIGLAKDFQRIHFEKSDSTFTPEEIPILWIKWNRSKNLKSKITDQQKLTEVIKMQAKLDTLVLLAY